jgi:hypothetical protein
VDIKREVLAVGREEDKYDVTIAEVVSRLRTGPLAMRRVKRRFLTRTGLIVQYPW